MTPQPFPLNLTPKGTAMTDNETPAPTSFDTFEAYRADRISRGATPLPLIMWRAIKEGNPTLVDRKRSFPATT